MQLFFVYNAKGGPGNSLRDILHKAIDPQTYECNLCALTHGIFSEKREWKRFTRSTEVALSFFHRDEFEKEYRSKWLPKFEYPVILSDQDGQLSVFASKDEIDSLQGTTQLIELIQERLDRC